MGLEERMEKYWEDEDTRSLIDVNLRKLEEDVVKLYLESDNVIIDIGCGEGTSTLEYAARVKRCAALERSKHLLKKAQNLLLDGRVNNLTFTDGDILELDRLEEKFDVAITQRVLINLVSWEAQKRAIDNVCSILNRGGLYIMIENTYEGQNAMNEFRKSVGLEEISIHWHNLYFHHDQLLEYLTENFQIVRHHTFDLYYLCTRVYMNMFSSFEGYGKNAVKDSIFEVADAAARMLYEKVGDKARIASGPSFGPVQAFVVRK